MTTDARLVVHKGIGTRIREAGDAAKARGVYEDWCMSHDPDSGALRYQAKLPGAPWGPALTPGEAVCIFEAAASASTCYEIAYLQAVEPETLPRDQGVTVFVHDERDGMGFNEVTISAPTREALIAYLRDEWGDEDADWFAERVAGIKEIPSPSVEVALAAVAAGLAQSECDTRRIGEGTLEFVYGGERYRLALARLENGS